MAACHQLIIIILIIIILFIHDKPDEIYILSS